VPDKTVAGRAAPRVTNSGSGPAVARRTAGGVRHHIRAPPLVVSQPPATTVSANVGEVGGAGRMVMEAMRYGNGEVISIP
jgi:hypothetical protein